MLGLGEMIYTKYGLAGLVNYTVATLFSLAYVGVQLVAHGSIFHQWPTFLDLSLTGIVALCLGLTLALEAWLEFRQRRGDGR